MTVEGFCVLAALSRYTSGRPCTSRPRTGKSARIAVTSSVPWGANDTGFITTSSCGVWQHVGELLLQSRLDHGPDDFQRQTAHDVGGERVNQHLTGGGVAQTARAQVE